MFLFEEAFCALRMRNEPFLIFDQLYLVTDMYVYGDGKGGISSFLLALSCGVNNFVQEELFILTNFPLMRNLKQNPETPLKPPRYC